MYIYIYVDYKSFNKWVCNRSEKDSYILIVFFCGSFLYIFFPHIPFQRIYAHILIGTHVASLLLFCLRLLTVQYTPRAKPSIYNSRVAVLQEAFMTNTRETWFECPECIYINIYKFLYGYKPWGYFTKCSLLCIDEMKK